MIHKKPLSFSEKLELLIRFDRMSPNELEDVAKDNNATITGLKSQLQEDCYQLDNVPNEDLANLNGALTRLSASDIGVMEKLNGMPLAQVKDTLKRKITEYKKNRQIDYHLMEAWKIKETQIRQQLINEELIIIEDDGRGKGFHTNGGRLISKRVREEKVKFLGSIAKKINLDCSFTFTIDQII